MKIVDSLPYEPDRTAFFTGHRNISDSDRDIVAGRIYQCITDAYQAGFRRFICGCALGFDTLAAIQTVRLRKFYPDAILSLALPCPSQAEKWKEKDRIVWHNIRELADDQVILSPFYYQGLMLQRNRYMADRSSLCICYLNHMRGGTASAVRYALIHDGIRIINLAVKDSSVSVILRENTWNCMCISPSAKRNAATAPFRLMPAGSRSLKRISD